MALSHFFKTFFDIFQGMRRNFISYRHGPMDSLNEPYDFKSIMHYKNKAFSKNGEDTLRSLKNPTMKLGQIKKLSKTDISQIRKLYHCKKDNWKKIKGMVYIKL